MLANDKRTLAKFWRCSASALTTANEGLLLLRTQRTFSEHVQSMISRTVFRLSQLRRTRFFRGVAAMEGRSSACPISSSEDSPLAAVRMQTASPAHEDAENNCGHSLHIDAQSSERCDQTVSHEASPQIVNASEEPSRGHVRRVVEGRYIVKFQLNNSCLLALHRGDITQWSIDGKTDAIVNAANSRMLGGGGVDGAIHRAAGPDLYEACLKLPLVGKNIRCRTGDAVITEGFQLPVSKIIHTVGPVYENDDDSGPFLESSYKSSLLLAVNNGLKYLAFPAISCGIYGYPYDKAAEIALDTVNNNSDGLKEVHFVLFEEGSWVQWLEKSCKSFKRLDEE